MHSRQELHRMIGIAKTLLLLSLATLGLSGMQQDTAARSNSPEYTSDAQLQFPEHYREWVFLSAGIDMSYTAKAAGDSEDVHVFDNVYVNPEAYQGFLKTGTWPDKTMLVLENRKGRQKGSINQNGQFQTALLGVEVHVKDEARFPGKWAFYGFGAHDKTSTMIPTAATCYSC